MEKEPHIILSIVIGYVSAFSFKYGTLFLLATIAIILDLVSAFAEAYINNYINSKKGKKIIAKNLVLYIALFVGCFLDYLEEYIATNIMDFGINSSIIPFGVIIGVYIIITLLISVCEHLEKCGVRLPHTFSKRLYDSKNKLDDNK